ncbi:nuclear transport factor 2 family protein [Streptomyces griseorubiginosus]|uniref:nuclear transport factor 2 family protein n=1 Tax=Streptomyces griseorubiginosus TaxID=67304 RepID=UPI00244E4256|nr:nuclear transport factor 2 family protein [Streptomyces griseorubiginosus]MBO4253118.1 hypothetical protein [Streptomyces griseorubiginosus]
MVVHFMDQLFNHGNLAVIDRFVRPDYIQHNPNSPDGPDALRRLVTGLRAEHPQLHVTVQRAIAEGDLVLLHSHSVSEPGDKGDAIVDIFRIQDGRIAEHWDVIQPVPDTTVSGNDMFSTLSAPQRQWPDPSVSTAASKRVATAMFNEVTQDRDATALDRYAVDPFYQHNPQSPNGTAAAKAFFSSVLENPGFSVSVKRVIAEGDYVAFHALYKFAPNDPGNAVLDLYRVRDGKVVEHWDVIQPVPAASANDNTMF